MNIPATMKVLVSREDRTIFIHTYHLRYSIIFDSPTHEALTIMGSRKVTKTLPLLSIEVVSAIPAHDLQVATEIPYCYIKDNPTRYYIIQKEKKCTTLEEKWLVVKIKQKTDFLFLHIKP